MKAKTLGKTNLQIFNIYTRKKEIKDNPVNLVNYVNQVN